jgi:hypothetical protein
MKNSGSRLGIVGAVNVDLQDAADGASALIYLSSPGLTRRDLAIQ